MLVTPAHCCSFDVPCNDTPCAARSLICPIPKMFPILDSAEPSNHNDVVLDREQVAVVPMGIRLVW